MTGQTKFWNRILFQLVTGGFYKSNRYIGTIKVPIGTDDCNVETYSDNLERY